MLSDRFTELPDHLRERVRIYRDGATSKSNFVLYWMRTAVRVDENPALDVAILLAQSLELPVLVYHAISQHYRFASDRHHTFMLEGARDVQDQFERAGISYAFHLATRFDARPYLVELAQVADVLVTEEMPVDPPRRFLNSLSQQVSVPILCVDTACIVPMQLVKRPFTRAFKFRQATKELYTERLTRPWPQVDVDAATFDLSSLPFKPVDLQTADLPRLVADCDIDHAVGPVVDTRGGSQAGYERWNQFRNKGLSSYAKRRNNALLDGVSRMSAYLHYGMVSPFRLAREAAQRDTQGSEKYLDELLIWRELAYAFCFHREDHATWSAIPAWAQETLKVHTKDARPVTYTWEQLARAQTDDELWNAAQLSLLRQGELHNNVRMTWGKAVLNWTRTPEEALRLMIDLNHRYALDGRDPASYGGLLWCLGQFDRPFDPEKRILGTVRPRPTTVHAKRLDTEAYRNRVARPRFDPVPRVAVIGAGISGLMAARTLADHGLPVKVFDKGRGVGGRMSTRRWEQQVSFDHGAQYFTARDPRFQRYVESWMEQGIVRQWPNDDATQKILVFKNGDRTEKQDQQSRYVGAPAMNQVCKHLASDLDVRTLTRIQSIARSQNVIRLTDQDGKELGDFDRLVVSAPAAQTGELLQNFPRLAEPISQIKMQPCWAVMASFAEPIDNDWAGAFIHDSILTWAARNSTKPGRANATEQLLLHASHCWTAENWEREPDAVAAELLAAFWESSGIESRQPLQVQSHRWKYAIVDQPGNKGCYFDSENGIVACGDWANGSRVEGAFLSGVAAAGRILGSLQSHPKNAATQQQLDFSA